MTVVKTKLALNDATVQFQLGEARSNIAKIDLGARTAPLVAAAVGVVLLSTGIVLIVRRRRQPAISHPQPSPVRLRGEHVS